VSTTYEPADDDVLELLAEVMREHHLPLHQVGTRISVVMAACEVKGEERPAMLLRGQVVAAKIQITSLVDRARGLADAKLTICQFSWDRLSEPSRVALLDHELEHLELNGEPNTEACLDDRGRPRLRMRHHDWELAGFAAVAERHREAAVEVQEVKRFQAEIGEQLGLWPTR